MIISIFKDSLGEKPYLYNQSFGEKKTLKDLVAVIHRNMLFNMRSLLNCFKSFLPNRLTMKYSACSHWRYVLYSFRNIITEIPFCSVFTVSNRHIFISQMIQCFTKAFCLAFYFIQYILLQ